nr:hypothetical protein [Tanacetum cinerariifolium]
AQLVPKSQGIGRCNNYAMLQINIEIIESFMHTVGYQGVVDKVSDFYRKYLAQPWQTMFKTMRNVTVRGMLIPDAFLTKDICATDDYKEYKTVLWSKVKRDEESYADKFAASMLHDDVDNSRDRIEPEIHKEDPKVVVGDDENKEGKKDDKMGI